MLVCRFINRQSKERTVHDSTNPSDLDEAVGLGKSAISSRIADDLVFLAKKLYTKQLVKSLGIGILLFCHFTVDLVKLLFHYW